MFEQLFPNAGLLGPDEQNSARNNLLLNFGLGLLANQYSPSTGQAIGQAGMQAMNSQNQFVNQTLQNKMTKQKIDDAERQKTILPQLIGKAPEELQHGSVVTEGQGLLGGKISPQQFYAGIAGLGGDYTQYGLSGLTKISGAESPASVREYEYFSKLPKSSQDQFLGLKRQGYQVGEIGGVPTLIPRMPGASAVPLSTLQNEVTGKAAIAGGTEAAKTKAEATTKAQMDLPTTIANSEYSIKLLDDLIKHPGLAYAVGPEGILPKIPGTDQADFITRLEQLQGKQFLEAYNTLKGGGQITEVEGKKAESAIARMSRAQSEKAFIEAAKEFQTVIRQGSERARVKAGMPAQTTSPTIPFGGPKTIKWNELK